MLACAVVLAAEASSAASSCASLALTGFIFQFPAMSTRRVRGGSWLLLGWGEAMGARLGAEAALLRGSGKGGTSMSSMVGRLGK